MAEGRRPSWHATVVLLLLVVGLAMRLAPIAEDPLHPDECLYATWALTVRAGDDPLLRYVPIDKPPLHPYLLAVWSLVVGYGPVALRLLGAACGAGTLYLTYALARRLVGPEAGLIALTAAALSPVGVALDATAFTDPPAVAMAMAGALAAAVGHPLGAGALLGLAVATKPSVVAFALLITAVLPGWRVRWRAGLSFAAVVLGVALWEGVRNPETGFVVAALANYGAGPAGSGSIASWRGLLATAGGAVWMRWVVGLLLLAGTAVTAWRRPPGWRLLAGSLASALAYAALQLGLRAPAWDRYLLPLVPLLALSLAVAAHALAGAMARGRYRAAMAGAAFVTVLVLWAPAQWAAQSRLSLGDTSAWQGIDVVAAYVRGQVPGRATVAYSDLGWSLRYYLWRFPQDFRWYTSEPSLLALAGEAEPLYLITMAQASADADREALRQAGYRLYPALTTYRPDGAVALRLERVVAEP